MSTGTFKQLGLEIHRHEKNGLHTRNIERQFGTGRSPALVYRSAPKRPALYRHRKRAGSSFRASFLPRCWVDNDPDGFGGIEMHIALGKRHHDPCFAESSADLVVQLVVTGHWLSTESMKQRAVNCSALSPSG